MACEKVLSEGTIGSLDEIRVRWRTNGSLQFNRTWSWRDDLCQCGGVLTDWSSHAIDYIGVLCESIFAKVSCSLNNSIKSRIDSQGSNKLVTAPDTLSLRGVMSNGFRVNVEITTVARGDLGHSINLIGSRDNFVVRATPPYRLSDMTYHLQRADRLIHKQYAVLDSRHASLVLLLDHFTSKISGSNEVKRLPTIADAKNVWLTLNAAQASAKFQGQMLRTGI